MTIAAFSVPSEEVELFVEPGRPDVLLLRTTNIPKIHSHLTQLRKRPDHPHTPREVWLDLTQCTSFVENRGDMLVRALRLTDFLLRGFIGEQMQVKVMADAARLPCVPNRNGLPSTRTTASSSIKPPATMALVEASQDMAIMQDMRRRLTTMETDYKLLAERSAVVMRALAVVRASKEDFEGRCATLREQVGELETKLDASKERETQSASQVEQITARLAAMEQTRIGFVERIQALETTNATAQAELSQARANAQALRFELLDLQNNPASSARIEELSTTISGLNARNAQLEEKVATSETALSEQRAVFEAGIASLEADLVRVDGIVAALRTELAAERARSKELLAERDSAQAQAFLATQMAEDALRRADEVSARSMALSTTIEEQKAARAALGEDHARLGLELRQAREQLDHATVQAQAARDFAKFQEDQIAALVETGKQADADRSALASARAALVEVHAQAAAAQSHADEARAQVQVLEDRLVQVQAHADEVASSLARIQQDNAALCAERTRLLETIDSLEATITANDAKAQEASLQLGLMVEQMEQSRQALSSSHEEAAQLRLWLASSQEQSQSYATALADTQNQLSSEQAARIASEESLSQAALAREQAQASAFVEMEASLRQEIAASRQETAKALANAQLHQADRDSLARRIAAIREESEVVQGDMIQAIDAISEDLSQMTALRDEARVSIASLHSQVAQRDVLIQQAALRQAELASQVDELTVRCERACARIVECEATIVEQSQTLQESEAARIELVDKSQALQQEIASRTSVIARQNSVIETDRSRLAEANECVARLTAERAQDTQALAVAQAQAERLRDAVEAGQETLSHLTQELTGLQAQVATLETASGELRARTQAAERLARAERLSRATLESELVNTQEALALLQEGIAPPAVIAAQAVACDRVVLDVPAGTQVLSEGSVHVYGALRGRVHAGCSGNASARIYCMSFFAREVAIAGHLVVLDSLPQDLAGRAVEVWFDHAQNCMRIEPMRHTA